MAEKFLKEACDTHRHLLEHRVHMDKTSRRDYIRRCLVQINAIGRMLLEAWEAEERDT